MSSPDIVRGIKTQIQNNVLPATNRYWQSQVQFGLQAYGLRPFQSATGNARMSAAKPRTGIRKSERLFRNVQLANAMGTVFDSLHLVRPGSFVNVDHSDMNGLTALVGAVQTRHGRAIPCLVETTYSDRLPSVPTAPKRKQALRRARTEARQWQSFTGHYIDALQGFHDRLGFWPRLVFDRGFGNESLVTHLQAEGATFYIRLKAGRFVELGQYKLQIKQLQQADQTVCLFGIHAPRYSLTKEPTR